MAFDYKREYKEFYLPPKQPGIVEIPKMNFLAVRGKGDPNEENGEYKRAMELLYGIAYTIKMSYKGEHIIEGFFEYVVPPLEGLWWQEGIRGVDYSRKDLFQWISLIRLPDFVKESDFEWALEEAARKKKTDFSQVEFFSYDEGLCVQCTHLGSYDDEPATIRQMETYAQEHGYAIDITDKRHHHEIYLSDPRKTEAAKLKTVIRHPVRKV
ncbi:MAG: GyrI-like domain-containing protein [Clostridium sp.]|nr:GyrI-like domain-containing protein [Clostridium sp.]